MGDGADGGRSTAAPGWPPLPDDVLISLSALQHFLFCPRQCALIHVEQAWAENALTVEGRLLHAKVETLGAESRRGVRTVTAMPIRSDRLGVAGIADVVEFDRDGRPFPVEYKRGRPKAHRADEVQLCAQAMALEEMTGFEILEGALFYGQTRRRVLVAFEPELRDLTAKVAREAAVMIRAGRTPPPVFRKSACSRCSLMEICRPHSLAGDRSAAAYLNDAVAE